MSPVYSAYEAKARFSEVLRLVREGTPVTISYRGDPVAEIRPLAPKPTSVEEHFARLEKRGIVIPAEDPRSPLEPGSPTPGSSTAFDSAGSTHCLHLRRRGATYRSAAVKHNLRHPSRHHTPCRRSRLRGLPDRDAACAPPNP